MENRRWLCYAVINCAFVCCIVAKTFSLNELIEAESNQKEVVHTTIYPKLEEHESTEERFTLKKETKPLSRLSKKFKETESESTRASFSLNKGLKPLSRLSKKFKETGATLNLIPIGKKISPLTYRKTFQIKSPLKPKRVKNSLKTRHKRKNQFAKSEIDENAILNQKYIPLLRSIGMLFDNILGPDSRESIEITKGKRLRYYFEDDDASCKCLKGESNTDSESEEKTITSSEAVSTEVTITTEATTTTTDNTASSDFGSFRRNKNVPVLLPRNTISPWRDDNGLGERSRTTYNWGNQGHISRYNGDSEHNTEWKSDKSSAQSDEEHTGGDSRDGASGIRTRGTIRGRGNSRNNTQEIKAVYESDTISKDEVEGPLDGHRGHIDEFYGQDKLETGRDKAESPKLLPESVRGQRGFLPKTEVDDSESIQFKEDDEESVFNVAQPSSSNQRIFDRDGTFSSEVQEADPEHETLIATPAADKFQTDKFKPNKTSRNGPVVVIIDGYSVTRHKNGENKLAEKAIRIRP